MPLYEWSTIEKEQLSPKLARRVVHADNMTVAEIHLQKGATVSRHSHINEQVTMMIKGRIKFMYPDHEETLGAGQVLHTPPNVPHSVEALEDSIALDFFSPRREDWIRGDDAYLRS
jgi:quercetin dioxygenase-like cupin family protein